MMTARRSIIPDHLSALGLERNPFPQTPDSECYFRTEDIERQFIEAKHCVLSGKGFLLLTGEVGTGKSTFLRSLMDALLAEHCAIAFVFNTFLQGRDLLLAINRDFGLEPGSDIAEDIDRLNHFLIDCHDRGQTCVVVIDDAQNLDSGSLELLRLLSNLETRQEKLVQIILSGQPEFLDILSRPEHRQFASRIVQHIQLSPLSSPECARYVEFRIARAGSDGRIQLDRSAHLAVYQHSKGNPRRVHLIMDRCMYGVLASENRAIDRRLVNQAASEVGMAPRSQPTRIRPPWLVAGLILVGAVAVTGAGVFTTLHHAAVAEPAPAHTAAPAATSTPETDKGQPAANIAGSPLKPTAAQAPAIPAAACLEAIGAGRWSKALLAESGPQDTPTLAAALAQKGLVLAHLPAGANLPQAATGVCRWTTGQEEWLLWHQAYPAFTLKDGDRGEAVNWLQTQLARTGFYSVPVDGIVGVHTVEALVAFRRQHGLPGIGEADTWTIFLLEHDPGRLPSATRPINQG